MADETNGSKANAVRTYVIEHPRATNARIASELAGTGVEVSSAYVASIKRRARKARRRRGGSTTQKDAARTKGGASQAKYPRHAVRKVLRIPQAILEQNAGKECTPREAA